MLLRPEPPASKILPMLTTFFTQAKGGPWGRENIWMRRADRGALAGSASEQAVIGARVVERSHALDDLIGHLRAERGGRLVEQGEGRPGIGRLEARELHGGALGVGIGSVRHAVRRSVDGVVAAVAGLGDGAELVARSVDAAIEPGG